jgi:multidrug efflux pump subunit AcrA (membrane-fusion protein)
MRILLSLMMVTVAAAAPKKVSVERRDLHQVLRLPATAAPMLFAQLAAPDNGLVTGVFVDVGSVVKKGDALAAMTPRTGKAIKVLAPFSGVVVARNAIAGVFVAENSTLFTEIDAGTMRLEMEVPEVDAGKVKLAMPVTASFVAMPSRQFMAKVSAIVPMIDGRTHTLHVDADLPNPDRMILAGMSGEATVDIASRSGALAIPAAAVAADGSVFRLDGDRARKTQVSFGIRDGEWIEVLAGLGANDVVLVGATREGETIAK